MTLKITWPCNSNFFRRIMKRRSVKEGHIYIKKERYTLELVVDQFTFFYLILYFLHWEETNTYIHTYGLFFCFEWTTVVWQNSIEDKKRISIFLYIGSRKLDGFHIIYIERAQQQRIFVETRDSKHAPCNEKIISW